MQTKAQVSQMIPARETPEIAPAGDSKQSKRGGRRTGAGRKPNLPKRLLKGYSRQALVEAVADLDLRAKLNWLLSSKNATTILQTLAFIRDTIEGRPAQAVVHSGAVLHAHWTPGKYSHMTDEEWADYAALNAKALNPAVPAALPDAPQNQTESNTAIEGEIVDSGTLEA